jgi:hypothetical protein
VEDVIHVKKNSIPKIKVFGYRILIIADRPSDPVEYGFISKTEWNMRMMPLILRFFSESSMFSDGSEGESR